MFFYQCWPSLMEDNAVRYNIETSQYHDAEAYSELILTKNKAKKVKYFFFFLSVMVTILDRGQDCCNHLERRQFARLMIVNVIQKYGFSVR